jgi:hypothetical protein
MHHLKSPGEAGVNFEEIRVGVCFEDIDGSICGWEDKMLEALDAFDGDSRGRNEINDRLSYARDIVFVYVFTIRGGPWNFQEIPYNVLKGRPQVANSGEKYLHRIYIFTYISESH